MMAVLS